MKCICDIHQQAYIDLYFQLRNRELHKISQTHYLVIEMALLLLDDFDRDGALTPLIWS